MSIETLCPPGEDLPNHLKTANGLVQPEIEKIFGKPLESVKAPSLDQLITKPEIGIGKIKKIVNPRVVKLKTFPQAPEPEIKTPEPEVKPATEEVKKPEYIDGPIFSFGVGAYRNLYNRYIEFTNDDTEIARKYTRMAIANDAPGFIQEYYADAKDKNGQYIIPDHVIRSELAHTPTKNEYIIKTTKTGEKIICSPEHEGLDVSILDFVSGFRRGADSAMMRLVQEVAHTLPSGKEGEVTAELLWSSPKSKAWEGFWINKYCKKFGYEYEGKKVTEEGREKLIVYSYKLDSEAESYIDFNNDLDGKVYQASYEGIKDEDKDKNGQLREIDVALKTLVQLDGPMCDDEVLSRAFAAKEKTERSKLMFGLDETTLKRANNPFLREQIEKNIAGPIADWLVDKIVRNTPDEEIQSEIEALFTDSLKDFFGESKEESQEKALLKLLPRRQLAMVSANYIPREVSGQDVRYAEALRKRQEVGGGFCGELGESSSNILSSPSIGSSNVINFSSRSGGFLRGVGNILSSAEKCSTCTLELCEGRCPNCEKKQQEEKKEEARPKEEYSLPKAA